MLEVPAPRESGAPAPDEVRFLPASAPQPNLWRAAMTAGALEDLWLGLLAELAPREDARFDPPGGVGGLNVLESDGEAAAGEVYGRASAHAYAHDGHHDGHGHHHHHHDPALSLRRLLGVGISGGIIPCPTALVVLLAAISLHRVGYGLVLILAFSFGLAAAIFWAGVLAFLGHTESCSHHPSCCVASNVASLTIGGLSRISPSWRHLAS